MTQMPAKEAAKLLRDHVEIRRKAGTGNPCLNQAIDAAVAALESVDCDTPPPADEIPTIEQMREILNGHPRERAMSEDATRGNFRAPK